MNIYLINYKDARETLTGYDLFFFLTVNNVK